MPTTYALKGVNFDEQEFSPSSDCAIWRSCISDGRLQGMDITSNASGIHVAAGWLMAGGKELQLPAAITIPASGNTSGYDRVVVNVDLTKASTEKTFKQGWLSLEHAATRDGFPALTQEDLAGSGNIYRMVLCLCSLSSSGVPTTLYTCGSAHGHASAMQVTLPKSAWSNKTQSRTVSGVTADANRCHVLYSFAPTSAANKEAYEAAGIWLSAQGDGLLTFKCDTVPTVDIVVAIYLG